MSSRLYESQTDADEHVNEFMQEVQERAEFFGFSAAAVVVQAEYKDGIGQGEVITARLMGEIPKVAVITAYAAGTGQRALDEYIVAMSDAGYDAAGKILSEEYGS